MPSYNESESQRGSSVSFQAACGKGVWWKQSTICSFQFQNYNLWQITRGIKSNYSGSAREKKSFYIFVDHILYTLFCEEMK